MKKIFLVASIILLGFSSNIFAQTPTIDTAFITQPIVCFGGTGEIQANFTQSTPFTTYFPTVGFYSPSNPAFFLSFAPAPTQTTSLQQILSGLNADVDYFIRLVDSTSYYTANPFGNGASAVGIYDEYGPIRLSQPDQLSVNTSVVNSNPCPGDCVASEEITITGGTQPYRYTLDVNPTIFLPSPVSHIISTVGNTFSPDTIICNLGDSIIFNLGAAHDAVEVDQATYLVNGTASNGGFSVAFGATDTIVSDSLGTFYYVCTPHAALEMKGVIIVNPIVDTVINLCEGSYNLVVNDTNGCSTAPTPYTLTIASLNPLSADTAHTNISCNNLDDGTAIVYNVSGGTPSLGVDPYTYEWFDGFGVSTGQITDTATGLSAGDYTCHVMDSFECIFVTAAVTINNPDLIEIDSSSSTNISCDGLNDGMVIVFVSGGTLPYSYEWFNGTGPIAGINNDTVPDLPAENYYVQVTDSFSCPIASSVTDPEEIINPDAIFADTEHINTSCFGGSDGTAIVHNISGGTPVNPGDYTYEWFDGAGISTGQTTDTAIGLQAGDYTCTIKDSLLCEFISAVVSIEDPSIISADTAYTNISCNGLNDGTAIVYNVSGGTPSLGANPYKYEWFDGAGISTGQTTDTATGLSAGDYTCTIKDSLSCEFVSFVITIIDPPVISADTAHTNISCNGYNDGTAIVYNVSGGTPSLGSNPYKYEWFDGAGISTGQTTDTAIGLQAGDYTCTIKDSLMCELISFAVTIVDPLPIIPSGTAVDISCNGLTDGAIIDLNLTTGGTPPYQYAVNDILGPYSFSANNLGPGSIRLYYKDLPGCIDSLEFFISEPAPLVAGTSVITDNLCAGDCIATTQITIKGGTKPYNYTLDTNPTVYLGMQSFQISVGSFSGGSEFSPDSLTINIGDTVTWKNLGGLHNINGTDPSNPVPFDNGPASSSSWSFEWIPDTAGTYHYQSDPAVGFGMTGVIIVKPYTLDSLCEGDSYNLVVSDTNGCVTSPANTSFSIAPILPIVPGLTVISDYNGYPVSCFDASDGEIIASATGGTGVFMYSIDTINFQLSQLFGSLLSDTTYTIRYKDDNECIADTIISLIGPDSLSAPYTQTNVSCFGNADGSAIINFNGGVTGLNPGDRSYTFKFGTYVDSIYNPTISFSTTALIPLDTGSYAYSVEDLNECILYDTIVITEPDTITYSIALLDYNGFEVSCFDSTNGQITFNNILGGNGIYETSIDSGNTYSGQLIYSGLSPGDYFLSVRDLNGCTKDTMVTLSVPDTFLITYTAQNPSCPNPTPFSGSPYCDGEILANIFSGGVGSIFYSLDASSLQTSALFDSLCGGLYTLQAIDDNGCIATYNNANLIEKDPYNYLLNSVSEYCSLPNGQASINNVVGGSPFPVGELYNYEWFDFSGAPVGQTNDTAVGLFTGTYFCTVTDANLCQFSDTIIVSVDPAFSITDSINPSCADESRGAIVITPLLSAGTPTPPNFTYQWSDVSGVIIGETAESIDSLPVGSYTVLVTDIAGCSVSHSVVINSVPNTIILSSIDLATPTCFGVNDAAIEIFASGGSSPLNYTYITATDTSTQDSSYFTFLSPDNYNLIVSDVSCSVDTSIIFSYPPELVIDTVIAIDVSCFGGSDGSIQTINAQGGTLPYKYSVDGSLSYDNFAFFNGYSAGIIYTVEVSDSNNCTSQDFFSVNEPTELQINIVTSNWNNYEIRCFGENSGFANITASGGISPYISKLYNAGTGIFIAASPLNSFNNLIAQEYKFEVIDDHGCIQTETIMYNEPDSIMHNFISTHITCSGWSNGSLTDSVYGGVGNASTYSYLWSNGGTSYTIDSIPAGIYTITIEDENNCISISSDTINDNDTLFASILSVQHVSCYDYCDGVISTTVLGGMPFYDVNGNPFYAYQWDDVLSQTNGNAIGLCANNDTNSTIYSCVITDDQGCSVSLSETVIQPDSLYITTTITSDYNFQDISCYGASDGKIKAVTVGGNIPYDYTWNTIPIQTTENVTGLPAGIYTVIVEDSKGCMDTTETILTEPMELSILLSKTDVNCFGIYDGTITADVDGGTPFNGIPPKYDYVWSNMFSEQVDISKATNLAQGIFAVTATDMNGCTIQADIFIREPAPLTLSVDSLDETCDLQDGKAEFSVEGGRKPYSYVWTNGLTTNPIVNLNPGVWSVTLIDSSGCEVTSSTVVNGFTDVFLPGNLSMMDTAVCLGESFFIDIQEKPGIAYEWEDGSTATDRWVYPNDYVNVYTLTIQDSACSSSYEVVATINVDFIDPMIESDPTVAYGDFPVVLLGEDITLYSDNNTCVDYTWEWTNDTISNNNGTITVSNLKESDWYYLYVQDYQGCLGYDSIYVVVGVRPYDAITPNNDGFNDSWTPLDIHSYENALVQVFNRWGGLVFESQGGENYQPWDGTNSGEELAVGTYYYIIDLNTGDDPQTGPITIIR